MLWTERSFRMKDDASVAAAFHASCVSSTIMAAEIEAVPLLGLKFLIASAAAWRSREEAAVQLKDRRRRRLL